MASCCECWVITAHNRVSPRCSIPLRVRFRVSLIPLGIDPVGFGPRQDSLAEYSSVALPRATRHWTRP